MYTYVCNANRTFIKMCIQVVSSSYRELGSDSYSKLVPNYTQGKLKMYLKELPLDMPMILISR